MTLLDMKKLVLAQMGEDAGQDEMDEYGELLGAYINEAYMQICRHKKQKFAEQTLSFSEGRTALSNLTWQATVILSVTDDNDANLAFDVLADMIFLSGGASGIYTVQYLYLPERLSLDTDSPDLREQDCMLLCDFATYRALSLGNPTRQKRAEFFLMRYLSGYSDQKAKQMHLVNKY